MSATQITKSSQVTGYLQQMKTTFIDTLEKRQLVHQVTDRKGLDTILQDTSAVSYAGFDATAQSFRVGHLLPLFALARCARAGHQALIVIGEATGIIGDSSGRKAKRYFLDPTKVSAHAQSMSDQVVEQFTHLFGREVKVLNNASWLGNMSFLDWASQCGRYFSAVEISKLSSFEDRHAEGYSLAELCYPSLQSMDFAHLLETRNCRVQIGGAAQWGNITQGIEFIRKTKGVQAYGITVPYETRQDEAKWGRDGKNPVWLSPSLTKPFDFYQYFLNTDDRDVGRYLARLTFRENEVIADLLAEHQQAPSRREAQKVLAYDVTSLIHGNNAAVKCDLASQLLFPCSQVELLDFDCIKEVMPGAIICNDSSYSVNICHALVNAGLSSSRTDAKNAIHQGCVTLNGKPIQDELFSINSSMFKKDSSGEQYLILGKGNKRIVGYVRCSAGGVKYEYDAQRS